MVWIVMLHMGDTSPVLFFNHFKGLIRAAITLGTAPAAAAPAAAIAAPLPFVCLDQTSDAEN